jgi:hypothetical protein
MAPSVSTGPATSAMRQAVAAIARFTVIGLVGRAANRRYAGRRRRHEVTDVPTYVTSIEYDDRMKSAMHHGSGPAALTGLEEKIDEVAGTAKWLQPRAPEKLTSPFNGRILLCSSQGTANGGERPHARATPPTTPFLYLLSASCRQGCCWALLSSFSYSRDARVVSIFSRISTQALRTFSVRIDAFSICSKTCLACSR